ncbi:unnamed protein product [Phytophthora lilii]|uniref:Unnamed protein product n=1 Tax=Phytophthora lilii TaxID=2077276 RepID=A0A9W6TJ87_9STRA|nr:unnamed protein product [Phytophthora lilii]
MNVPEEFELAQELHNLDRVDQVDEQIQDSSLLAPAASTGAVAVLEATNVSTLQSKPVRLASLIEHAIPFTVPQFN